jgi:DNA mismatch endonuclease (patch repair protein)
MKAVKGKDTAPEIVVRRLCRELEESGYRLHRKDLPGAPDLACTGRIFMHGCFWSRHACKAGSKVAKTNAAYWRQRQ